MSLVCVGGGWCFCFVCCVLVLDVGCGCDVCVLSFRESVVEVGNWGVGMWYEESIL
jgi:hypothetical protein